VTHQPMQQLFKNASEVKPETELTKPKKHFWKPELQHFIVIYLHHVNYLQSSSLTNISFIILSFRNGSSINKLISLKAPVMEPCST